MKAQLLTTPKPVDAGPLALTDLPVPEPKDDEVLIKVHACGICRTDLHVVEGELVPKRESVVPGHQVIGTIVTSGAGSKYSIGSRVGVAWLHRTCGICEYCRRGQENLCERPNSPDTR